MTNKFSFTLVLSLVAGILFLFTGCSGNNSSSLDSAPDFTLKNLNNESVSLSHFSGKSVLINFWATNCPPCIAEMPGFQELHEDWSDRNDVVFLAVNLGENPSLVKRYIQSNNYSFTVLLDTYGEVFGKFRLRYTPTTLFIGQDGEIKVKVVGPFKNKEAILKAIGSYLD